jgi:hypothetical protein
MPALPLHEAGKYVAAAYLVFLALILIYVAIMAVRLGRVERELGELLELTEERDERNRGEVGPGSERGVARTPATGDPSTRVARR